MTERAYFDWNATAPLCEEARAAMADALGRTGNASSVHAEGRAARHAVEKARENVAALAGAEPRNVIFTSGATEANALALTPALETGGHRALRDKLFVSAIEHPSVRAGGRFPAGQAEDVPVTGDGVVDLPALRRALARAERPLVSVMLANNETGVVQPINAIAEIVHAANGLLHVDAVQGPGRLDCDINALGADLMSLSAHKLGGPQGVGALIRRGDIQIAESLIRGGGQERGGRAGTENVPGIAGFGAAAAVAAKRADVAHMVALRDRLEVAIKAIAPDVVIFGVNAPRLANTTLFAIPGMKAETAIIALDLKGIAVSSGSACSSGKVQASHVLAAMGVEPALAHGAVRVSLGWSTNEREIDMLLAALTEVVSSLRKGHIRSGLAA